MNLELVQDTVNMHFEHHIETTGNFNMEADLPYELEVIKENDYLHAVVTGNDSSAVTLAFFKELFEICKKEDCNKILIEENLTGNMSVTELYDVTGALSENILQLKLKIAFYDRFSEHLDINKFGETVALNQGWNFKMTNSLDEAKAWLKEKSELLAGIT